MEQYTEISTKFFELEEVFKKIQQTRDKIAGLQKALVDIQQQKSIHKLDIFMTTDSIRTITHCEELWKQIQQSVILDIISKLHEEEQQYQYLCRKFDNTICDGCKSY